MGLLTGLLGLPLAPLRGVLWMAEQIREHAEEQYYDPVRIRAQLERVDEARRTGELPEEECDELENELLQRLMVRRRSAVLLLVFLRGRVRWIRPAPPSGRRAARLYVL